MRKILIALFAILAFGVFQSNAQSTYTTALGLGIDFGDNSTLVGPSVKHFFTENHVGQGEVTFGDDLTVITALYQYHGEFPNAAGLKWFAGGGVSIALYDGGSDFFLRPTAGLDYKINNVPLAFSFDWRPSVFLGDNNGGDTFQAGRFGLGFRYTFN